jgi:hypothetical protein
MLDAAKRDCRGIRAVPGKLIDQVGRDDAGAGRGGTEMADAGAVWCEVPEGSRVESFGKQRGLVVPAGLKRAVA